ncbi:efflux RND transporter permease subunit [Xanthobacter tagetidis]|uniref:Efflux RND transporter permease subunit n=1 Tax=Xanthobacter tagetidis TaxID=60216 RepID=A0A3L7A2D0_9HYPH|nr:efflux RND transporter permease subunit [Xanthobacter tagetidis]MBB6309258.1 HAE1 family hydrophobic/amphiphilic exporter-1 [Xanthobacter tagetidis]RLP74214.1 efflux RND transporter permease subunit [Xanthobacter tagetidis]
MALNVSAWAIRKPIPSLVLFVVLTALGIVHFRSLPVTQMPNIDVPIVMVTVTQAGAAPSELETQVTKKVENAIAGVSGVKHITSSISEGTSVTTVEFHLETLVDRAVNDTRDAVTKIRTELPRTIDEPLIQRVDIEGLPIVTFAVSSPAMTPEELSWFVDDTIARALQGIRGVAQVKREGGVDREIRVALDPDRLMALGVTAAEVSRQLRATNVDVSGGRGEVGTQEQSIRTLAGAASVEDLADTRIALSNGRSVRLKDLGTVSDGAAEPRVFAQLNGKNVVAFGVYRAKGFSDVTVYDRVQKDLDKLRAAYPNVTVTEIDTTVRFTKSDYQSAMHTLIEGAILAVIVVFLFLRDFRATVITTLAIPLSILPTFWVMDMLGFSLNAVSLLAVTLVTGILVDDAIVEIENIVRHMRQGKSPYRAAIEAADEIGLAVMATTLTIVAVFVPVSFMGGIAGQYFKQFGITVAIAVLFSLAVARLITPLLAAYFLRDGGHVPKDGIAMRGYMRLLGWSVRHRFVTIAMGLGIFVGTVFLSTLLPSGFLPTNDISRSMLSIELPPGTTLAETQRVADRITRMMLERPEVRAVYATAGGGGQGGLAMMAGEVRKAQIVINLKPRAEREISQKAFEAELRAPLAAMPDMRVTWSNDGQNAQRGFQVILSGNDGAAVEKAALALEKEIRDGVPELTNVVSSAALDRPEIRIVPKLDEAADLGVSVDTIAETVRIATIGDISANLAKFSASDRQIDIRVQLDERARTRLATFDALKVPTASGAAVPLSAVARVEFGKGPTALDRYDRARRIAVEADLVGATPLGSALDKVKALPAARNLPAGVTLKEAGDAEIMEEVFSGFAMAMGAGLMMVLAVLVLLFHDVLQPITILISLPLSVGGAFIALLVTGNSISLPVVIGFLMLMGIVTKNAILLVDFAIEAMAHGMDRTTALMEAGHKRAQPIVMTTIAMVAGMVPSALAFGEGGAFRAPMAIAVIGGLITSTVLSLVFVPAVFSVMDDVSRFLGRLFGRFIGARDEAPEAGPGGHGDSPHQPTLPGLPHLPHAAE